jgi:hypothetical protein
MLFQLIKERVVAGAREYTCKLLDMVDEGLIDKDYVIRMCLGYLSEADVKDMMYAEELISEKGYAYV